MPYAARTSVPVERTRAEIERLVVGTHKATQYVALIATTPPRAMIQFTLHDRIVRLELPLPMTPSTAAREQAYRARWRALLLVVKAKLEAVAAGVTTFEEEFLAHIVVPGGQTVGQWMRPQIAEAYRSGAAPKALEGFSGS